MFLICLKTALKGLEGDHAVEACRPQIFAMVKLAMKDMALSSTQIRAARRSMPKNQRRFTLRGLSGIFRSLLLRRFSFNQKRVQSGSDAASKHSRTCSGVFFSRTMGGSSSRRTIPLSDVSTLGRKLPPRSSQRTKILQTP